MEKKKITVDIYDDEGDLVESIGGRYDGGELLDLLEDVIRNDGIPIIRKAERPHPTSQGSATFPKGEGKEDNGSRLIVHVQFGGMTFHAEGRAEDVLDAQADFMAAALE